MDHVVSGYVLRFEKASVLVVKASHRSPECVLPDHRLTLFELGLNILWLLFFLLLLLFLFFLIVTTLLVASLGFTAFLA